MAQRTTSASERRLSFPMAAAPWVTGADSDPRRAQFPDCSSLPREGLWASEQAILCLSCNFNPSTLKDVKAAAELERGVALTHFVTTRWSLIRPGRLSGARTDANSDLARLCEIYWRPIFTFIYRRGYPIPDAQDLTQDFFVMILEGSLIQTADPGRGRFRSLLLRSLENFLIDAELKRRRHKRGGAVQFISWEKWLADTPSHLALSGKALQSSPDKALFDLGWAAAIAEEALRRLQLECESKGRRRVFEVLQGHLISERSDICYENLSSVLGVPEGTVKNLLHEFRKRYRALLREEVAKTVETEANVDDEIRYLCATLSGATD
jgi:RNA polymerase sigma-70 factor (ECF subfamily)